VHGEARLAAPHLPQVVDVVAELGVDAKCHASILHIGEDRRLDKVADLADAVSAHRGPRSAAHAILQVTRDAL
jgi:hypothetical protein